MATRFEDEAQQIMWGTDKIKKVAKLLEENEGFRCILDDCKELERKNKELEKKINRVNARAGKEKTARIETQKRFDKQFKTICLQEGIIKKLSK